MLRRRLDDGRGGYGGRGHPSRVARRGDRRRTRHRLHLPGGHARLADEAPGARQDARRDTMESGLELRVHGGDRRRRGRRPRGVRAAPRADVPGGRGGGSRRRSGRARDRDAETPAAAGEGVRRRDRDRRVARRPRRGKTAAFGRR